MSKPRSLSHEEKVLLLTARRLPGRLTAEETAALLGFHTHDIPVLVRRRLLKTSGHPKDNATRYFHGPSIDKLRDDEGWNSRATDTMYRHWQNRSKDEELAQAA